MSDRFYRDAISISKEDFWKVSVCPTCHALVYKYETKNGKSMKVTLLNNYQYDDSMDIHDMFYERWGNNNNYVYHHECFEFNAHRHVKCGALVIDCVEVNGEVKSKVNSPMQQQAVMRALIDFDRPRVRKFKKSMLAQAKAFLAGEATFKNPFSPAQQDEMAEVCVYEYILRRPKEERFLYSMI